MEAALEFLDTLTAHAAGDDKRPHMAGLAALLCAARQGDESIARSCAACIATIAAAEAAGAPSRLERDRWTDLQIAAAAVLAGQAEAVELFAEGYEAEAVELVPSLAMLRAR